MVIWCALWAILSIIALDITGSGKILIQFCIALFEVNTIDFYINLRVNNTHVYTVFIDMLKWLKIWCDNCVFKPFSRSMWSILCDSVSGFATNLLQKKIKHLNIFLQKYRKFWTQKMGIVWSWNCWTIWAFLISYEGIVIFNFVFVKGKLLI